MFCRSCGKEVDDQAIACPNCGMAVRKAPGPAVKIENHVAGAIATTLCCCLPFGIVAIVYACKVNTLAAQGDAAGAQRAADTAKNWILAGVIVGFIVQVLNAAIQFLGAAASSL